MNDSASPLIQASDVRLEYRTPTGRQTILEHLTFELGAGRQTALLGRSGSGKTTLLHACAGLLPVAHGSLNVCAHPLHSMSESERTAFRRRHIGLVFQQFNLVPTLTVLENLQFVCALNRHSTAQQALLDLLERLDIADKHQRFPAELSGGEQQRVAVARALAHRPALVLADEPTGNLDAETAAQVMALLTGACREYGAGLVLVTHGSELPAGLDAVARLEHGRLVFERHG